MRFIPFFVVFFNRKFQGSDACQCTCINASRFISPPHQQRVGHFREAFLPCSYRQSPCQMAWNNINYITREILYSRVQPEKEKIRLSLLTGRRGL
jgi:hypothetical protein